MIDFLIYLGYFILLINLILYSISFFWTEKANVFFVGYLAFTSFVQFGMEVLYHLKMNNLLLVNFFFIGQMILLGLFYKSLFKSKTQKRIVTVTITLALIIFGIQFYLDSSQWTKFNLLEITITSLLIVGFALIHFYNMLTEPKEYYYVTIGVIIYLLGATVLLLIGNLSQNLSDDIKYLSWTLNAFLVVIYYFTILFEWKISFKKQSS
ncbi:hypothetical protein [Flavobacterium ajazii]|uniref:hypothetical protein n=1 Tax=Flavobacterium ajazii TaxID=2692318 RepID=UPI0013D4097A|nr:hypothetical protein [Flavobacterium ajazii]